MNVQVDIAALQAQIEKLTAQNAELAQAVLDARRVKPTFKVAENNPNYFNFYNGIRMKGVHPMCSAHKDAWRVILANVDMIKTVLDNAQ